MKSFCLTIFLTPLLLFAQTGTEILNDMIKVSGAIKTMEFNTVMRERFNGKLQLQKSYIKLENNPYRIYYRQDYPHKGIEILYTENNNKALVNPNGFPWVNINLPPLSSQLRVKQHHTLFHPGFEYLVDVIKYLIDKNKNNINNLIEYKGTILWNNINCYKLTLSNPEFKYVKYTVKNNETIDDIADKFYISSYMILEINRNIDNYEDVTEGQQIVIPNTYAKQMTMYIDAKRKIPLVLKIYDDKGLFEHYEFYNIKIDKKFEANEFTPDFDSYNF